MGLSKAEFTVEPFNAGQPGLHVDAAVAAVEALGVEVEVGPFASSIVGDAPMVAECVCALIKAATTAGATRISITVEGV